MTLRTTTENETYLKFGKPGADRNGRMLELIMQGKNSVGMIDLTGGVLSFTKSNSNVECPRSNVQRGAASTLWSAVTCHRFHMRRLDAAIIWSEEQFFNGRDRSRPNKAVTGHRTPGS